MPWRKIIRGICIALLTLCVTAWVASYFQWVGVLYGGKWYPSLGGGELMLMDLHGSSGWDVKYGPYDTFTSATDQRMYDATANHLLGFAWQPATVGAGFYMMIPLWFPTLLSAGFLWLVWRKTRPKYNGKGFPVEVVEKKPKP